MKKFQMNDARMWWKHFLLFTLFWLGTSAFFGNVWFSTRPDLSGSRMDKRIETIIFFPTPPEDFKVWEKDFTPAVMLTLVLFVNSVVRGILTTALFLLATKAILERRMLWATYVKPFFRKWWVQWIALPVVVYCVLAYIFMWPPVVREYWKHHRRTSSENVFVHNLRGFVNCNNNLKLLNDAVNQWAIKNNQKTGTIVTLEQIRPFLKDGTLPNCPDGGIYHVTQVGEPPTCSLGSIEPTKIRIDYFYWIETNSFCGHWHRFEK